MTFVKYEVPELAKGPNGTGLKATIAQRGKTPTRLWLSLGKVVFEAIGFSDGDRCDILIGTGENAGKLRLRKNNSTGTAVAMRRKSPRGTGYHFRIDLGHVPQMPEEKQPARWCQWHMRDDGWLEVILPAWQRRSEPKPLNPRVHPAALAPQVRKGNRTAEILGDPPPARSALAQRGGAS